MMTGYDFEEIRARRLRGVTSFKVARISDSQYWKRMNADLFISGSEKRLSEPNLDYIKAGDGEDMENRFRSLRIWITRQ